MNLILNLIQVAAAVIVAGCTVGIVVLGRSRVTKHDRYTISDVLMLGIFGSVLTMSLVALAVTTPR